MENSKDDDVHPDPGTELYDEALADGGGPIKPFLGHLEDLRWVLIRCVASVGVAMVVCLISAKSLVWVLQLPLLSSGLEVVPDLMSLGPTTGFIVALKMAMYGGLIVASPFLVFFIGQFVIPALKNSEKKFLFIAFGIGTGLFFLGVALCYFYVAPIGIRAMANFSSWLGFAIENWKAESYFDFITKFMLGMGASFEMPVIVLSLVKIGLVDYRNLAGFRRYMIVICMVISAILTPQDIISMVMVAIPLIVLYEICIWIAWFWFRKEQKEAEKEA
jgi:sec-independent protein translocase protein TatC